MTVDPAPAARHLTVPQCDRLLAIYTRWLHARSSTTRKAAQRAVEGLLDERKAARERAGT